VTSLQRAVDGGEAEWQEEYRFERADGAWADVLDRGYVVWNAAGESVRMVGSILDVTARKEAERALVEAKERAEEMSRLKSAFLANMSHEIRTPLTGILGFADILADEAPPDMRECVDHIQMNGRRLMDTLTSVLDLAQIESGALALQTEAVPVAERVVRACDLFSVQAQAKGIWLDVTAPDAGLTAEADRRALDRVLDNLISNAVKFTAEGGVTVAVSATEEHVEVAISDTGIGIGEAAQNRLFDAFYQESSGLHRDYEGCGLGLVITKELADMMRGEIEVASQKGSGTTFRLRLPRATDDPAAYSERSSSVVTKAQVPAPRQNSKTSQGRPQRSVLVVEDNEVTRHLFQRVLKGLHEATFAASASEALALARKSIFDVVLLDINLGHGQSGEDVLHELRRMSAYRRTPIIAVTAHALPDDEKRFLEAGFDGYLSKPFTMHHLEQMLECVMDFQPAAGWPVPR
jgi:signal transduction histidine kinase/ActR/RegA family two-component response regulator